MNSNHVTLAGFTTDAATVKAIGERKLCEFTLAYNRKPHKEGQKGSVDFIDVKLWGRDAEAVARVAQKGVPLVVIGPLRQDRWETAEGEARSRVTVEAYIVARQIVGAKAEATKGTKATNAEET